jgi:prepilin peptidase dependent protein B
MLINRKKQTGVTLIELMIGLLIGVIVVAGGISIFLTSVKGQTDNINLTRLNQDMRTMMDIMVRDIRRAGFVTSNPDDNFALVQSNPFFGATTDLAVYDTNTCIVYAYNSDNDDPPVVDSSERFGFRLNTTTNVLEMRSSGTSNVNCNEGSWQTITEPEVAITGLTFTLTSTALNVTSMNTDTDGDSCYDGDDADPAVASAGCVTGNYGNNQCDTGEACNTCTRDGSPDPACLYVRNVAISLTGRLRDDNTVTQTIAEQTRVRNDNFLPAIP